VASEVAGLDVLSWIRGQKKFRTLPVALMSTGPDPTLLEHAAALGRQFVPAQTLRRRRDRGGHVSVRLLLAQRRFSCRTG